ADLRILRRLTRDTQERGRSMESVINQYLNVVRPMHEQFIEPTKKHADIIIPEGGSNKVAIDIMTTKIQSLVSKK
ncbi:uridine kinase, partial [Staphylococcus aureus]|nr:uridine kinase [Staphylococcus aureus]